MSFLDRIAECAVYDSNAYLPFLVGDQEIGGVRKAFAETLAGYAETFEVTGDDVRLSPALQGFEARTAAMADVLGDLRSKGLVPGWRDEPYPAGTGFDDPALFNMERAAVPLFGVRGYGVHMNGWLEKDGGLHMWIGRRSLTKPTGPGKLDQMVGGGQPSGMSLRENMIKECQEEAGMPAEIAENVVSVGTVSYRTERPEGLRHDVLFNFDLEVPVDFQPVNEDGEVAEFMLWPIEKVMDFIRDTDQFKFNSALVIIDFLVRRGYIDADDPNYAAIVSGLHR